jgi:hypothetical protein
MNPIIFLFQMWWLVGSFAFLASLVILLAISKRKQDLLFYDTQGNAFTLYHVANTLTQKQVVFFGEYHHDPQILIAQRCFIGFNRSIIH